ncbi:hypothetical protein, partial [Bacillus mycoides]|uniref:hypothetical protein n=1 Tax=Bacillus mycoides TaxID=1405 RepID=UPI0021114FAD
DEVMMSRGDVAFQISFCLIDFLIGSLILPRYRATFFFFIGGDGIYRLGFYSSCCVVYMRLEYN